MVWAFITDVIDYHQYKTGLREDGTVYGVNSFARKVGQACAGAVRRIYAGTHWLPIVYNRWSHPISFSTRKDLYDGKLVTSITAYLYPQSFC